MHLLVKGSLEDRIIKQFIEGMSRLIGKINLI